MKQINIGIAGCLGRMGSELVKKSTEDSRINFAGGFEHPEHNLIDKNLSEILECETSQTVSLDAEEIFSNSDVPKLLSSLLIRYTDRPSNSISLGNSAFILKKYASFIATLIPSGIASIRSKPSKYSGSFWQLYKQKHAMIIWYLIFINMSMSLLIEV